MITIITIAASAVIAAAGIAVSWAAKRAELAERELANARAESAADRRALDDARQSLAQHREARERQARSIAELQQLAERSQVDRAAVVGVDAMRARVEEVEADRDRALAELARRSPKHHVWHEGECLLCGAGREAIRASRYTYWLPNGLRRDRAPECDR